VRRNWQLVAAGLLLVLLAIVATLQYRWLGEVSDAERDRMRATLKTRAGDFAQAFDRELTRIYLAFRVDSARLEENAGGALADAYDTWQAAGSDAGVVDAIYLVEIGPKSSDISLKKLDPGRRVLEPVAWPASLSDWRLRAEHLAPTVPVPALVFGDTVDASVPALVISAPTLKRVGEGGVMAYFPDANAEMRLIVVTLSFDAVREAMVRPLVAKYFTDGATQDYVVTVVKRSEPSSVVYSSEAGAQADTRAADVTQPFFALRLEDVARMARASIDPPGRPPAPGKFSITIVRRDTARESRLSIGLDGAWEARIRHRDGSLEAVVQQSRRRNLAIGGGVLLLIATSVLLVIASAQRQQRLARQQMEFVAAVSHELRTPLTVIRSAGENLADGVVSGQEQVRQYGSLIETEGRRLTDMVERVLEFAGISSGGVRQRREAVDLSHVIAQAVKAVRSESVEVRVSGAGSLPPIVGDENGLQSAIQNVVGNAIKYSPAGGVVDVVASVSPDRVRIDVADHGLGIDPDDMPYVFKPFFRGRRAVDAQIRGSGVGLSVVRHVIDAHGGDVRIESRPGAGTTVIIELPSAPAIDGANAPRGEGTRPVAAPASPRSASV